MERHARAEKAIIRWARGVSSYDMDEEQARLDEELRHRFPWLGLGPPGETELSSRYRETMAQARVNQETIDDIRRS